MNHHTAREQRLAGQRADFAEEGARRLEWLRNQKGTRT